MSVVEERDGPTAFQHLAFLYRGDRQFLAGALAFIRDGLQAGEATLVAVSARKIGLLEEALGPDAARVSFVDMDDLGANPARIIPAWAAFLDSCAADQGSRGIGEPVTASLSADEVEESLLHERLLNVAFDGGAHWQLMCPYDVDALSPETLVGARMAHPYLTDVDEGAGVLTAEELSELYRKIDREGVLDLALPQPPASATTVEFDAELLATIRELVQAEVVRLGFARRAGDFVLAVSEAITNTVRHAGTGGRLRLWTDGSALVCEVTDSGRISEPLAGRIQPPLHAESGRGLWLINNLCDFVQVRSGSSGTTVRMHLRHN